MFRPARREAGCFEGKLEVKQDLKGGTLDMKKRKLLALLLAGSMMLGLAACGGGTQGGSESPSGGGETVSGGETEGKTVKVGLICIGDENDQGYTYNFIRGKEAVTEALAEKGITIDWQIKWNIGEDSSCEDANIELAEAGCDLIINNSYRLHQPGLRRGRPAQHPQRLRQHL